MAYSKTLAERIQTALARRRNIGEKYMFGGVAYLLKGNFLVGVWKDSLIARLGPDCGAVALQEPHVRPFDITGKPMRGWVMIDLQGLPSAAELERWIDLAFDFVRSLPPKK